MKKYVIIQFLEDVPADAEFPASSWPLHITIAANFTVDREQAGADFQHPHYMETNYQPHATAQRHARIHPGNTVHINALTLVDMAPEGNTRQRKVLKTFELGAGK